MQVEKILTAGKNNPPIPGNLKSSACLKLVFESSRTYGLFNAYFSSEIYNYAASYFDTPVRYSFMHMDHIVGITKVLEDVEISKPKPPLYQDVYHFLEEDFVMIRKAEKLPDKFKPYLTARVTLKSLTGDDNFQILSISDDKANISKPNWFQSNGIGYLILSFSGSLKIIVQASVDGKINLTLGGMQVTNPEDKTKDVPYWIDYTALIVNSKTIFDTLTPTWRHKLYHYNMDVKSGEKITVNVEWLPHRSDT